MALLAEDTRCKDLDSAPQQRSVAYLSDPVWAAVSQAAQQLYINRVGTRVPPPRPAQVLSIAVDVAKGLGHVPRMHPAA